MITDEQIFQIAREHLYILTSVNEWCGEDEDILNFARAIYEIAYNEGHDEGWESREEAEYFNSSYPTGLVGDPQ
jgi:hypothetical protein